MTSPPETVTFLAAYDSIEAAGAAVSALVANGVTPAALELMDEPAIQALEEAFQIGYPPGAGAVLLIDVDGLHEAVEEQAALVGRICQETPRLARPPVRRHPGRARQALGRSQGRPGSLRPGGAQLLPLRRHRPALAPGRRARDGPARSPSGTVCSVLTVAHIGDGNIHPMIMFDAGEPGILPRVEAAHDELVEACVDAGGTITGEHGVGLEKRKYMPLIFTADDLERMALRARCVQLDGPVQSGQGAARARRRSARVAIPVGVSAAVGPETWV